LQLQPAPSPSSPPPLKSSKDLIREVIAIAIWVPYFNMSKRVKNTFVE